MKRKLWLIPALITGLCMVLSFIAGHYVPWTPLGTPPEPAVEILKGTQAGVIVRTSADRFYYCGYNPPLPRDSPRGCTWEERETAPENSGDPENDDRCIYLIPPGWVTDLYYVCGFPGWRYVILNTGSVWVYRIDGDDLAVYWEYLRFLYCFPLGTAGGLLLGIITYGLLYWRRRRAAKSR